MSQSLRKIMEERQNRHFKRFPKKFYTINELMDILGITYEEAKQATRGLIETEQGYPKLDIIINLMGGMLYQTKI